VSKLEHFTRRQLLRSAGLMAGAVALAACDTAPNATGGGPSAAASGGRATGGTGGTGPIKWWDQFNPLQELQRATFKRFTEDGGAEVEYTVYNPNEQGQALQLAFGSKQLPDVYTLAGVSVPAPVLLEQGWFSPLTNADDITGLVPEGSVLDGLHIFDGQLYSFPIFSFRQYETLGWYNRGLVEKAGLDPDDPPRSWDDFRAAARAVQKSGTSGLLLPLKFADRMAAFVLELAQTAGFPGARVGVDGIDLTTGEYRFHDDAFVDAIEFLLAFQKDGLLFPASTSLDARAGRARWAANASGYFFDGPYNVGVISGDFEPFLEQLGVGPIPTPDGGDPVLARTPIGGTFWVSGQSDKTDQASELLALFAGKEYQSGLAAAMDQPPFDLDAVADSEAHETYKQCIEYFKAQTFLAPSPQARNPLVSQVEGKMKAVDPGLGPIIQGAFSGQITDVRGALKQLSDGKTAARDAAISEVGGDVSVDDWKFADWTVGEDYGPDKYAS
jgi:multiple sugar transport system substrate-binding protein